MQNADQREKYGPLICPITCKKPRSIVCVVLYTNKWVNKCKKISASVLAQKSETPRYIRSLLLAVH